jgi:integrase
MGKRAAGEGTVYERPNANPNSRWAAEKTVHLPDGRKKRVTGYGPTQAAAMRERERKAKETLENAPSTKMTVGQFLDYYLQQRSSEVAANTMSIRTYSTYETDVRENLKPHIGGIPLALLKPHHIQELVSILLRTKSAPVARKARATLNTALGYAVDWGLLNANPVPKRSQISERHPDIEVWTEDEVIRFLQAALTHRLYALFYVAIMTGMRQGELLGLRWNDIDLNENIIRIRYSLKHVTAKHQPLALKNKKLVHLGGPYFLGEPKTPKSRRQVELPADTIQVLAAHYEAQQLERQAEGYADHNLVFCRSDGQPMVQRTLKDAYDSIIKQAGISKARFHDQRDLSASLMIAKGVDIAIVSERLGHSRTSTTWDKYVRVVKSARKRSVMSMDELLKRE